MNVNNISVDSNHEHTAYSEEIIRPDYSPDHCRDQNECLKCRDGEQKNKLISLWWPATTHIFIQECE